MRRFAREASWLWVCLVLLPGALWGQTTYHLRAAASSTPGLFQLQTTGPNNTPTVGLMSGPMVAPGDYQVAGFNTQAGVPGTLGYFPTGSKFTFSLWMQTSIAGRGPVYPEAKVYINNSSGVLLCGMKSGSALTTNLQPFNFSCTTATNIGMQTTDRLYLWVGAAQAGIGGPTLRAKLSIEGALNGNYDSLITVPSGTLVPVINTNGLSPNTGGVNTAVTITGNNFGTSQQGSVVTFNGTPATQVPTWTNTGIIAKVPLGAFSGPVVVSVAGVPSNGVNFTDTSPSISGLSINGGPLPASMPPGSLLTIRGANFGFSQGGSMVTVSDGTTNATAYAMPGTWTNTSVNVTVPRGPTAGNVSVVITVGGTASNAVRFVLQPWIDSLSVPSGQVHAPVTISGAGFGATPGNSLVTFGGTRAWIGSWSSGSIGVTVPNMPTGSVNVVVTVNGVPSNGVPFLVSPPYISGLSRNSGPVGVRIKISGMSFGSEKGTVAIGGTQMTVTVWQPGVIWVLVPCGISGTSNVVVTRADGAVSNSVPFTVTLQ
ncbi:MAG TPA: IPT/TIG domain-containing protein [Terriglobales bacterium]|nr:IPT/TIG domain-containing protein [Terriglobales bacterium]